MLRKSVAFLIAFHMALFVGTVESSDDKGAPEDPESNFPVLSGIGVALSITDDGPQIATVLPGSVAEKSGRLNRGDRILSIRTGDRTIELKGKHLGDVVSLIRGAVGTTVSLEILSANGKSRFPVTLKREAVPLPALTQHRTYKELIGKPMPPTQFSALDHASEIFLSKYAGKVVVIDFWASWCGTCYAPVDKMQEIARAHTEWKDRVVLVTATIDTDLQAASKIVETRKWTETTHLSLAPEKLEAIKIVTIPVVIILSHDGKIAAVGDPHSISIEKVVSKLLSPPAANSRGSESPK